MVEMEETCYRAFHCAGNNLIMRLRTFCTSWVNWGMNICYDVSKIPMMNKTMFKSGGQYCLMLNRHNDDDVKLMSWLMNGANHGTVDTCGENVNSLNDSLIHARVGERVILGNNSRLLGKELGQQVPIKSRQKMNRDISKFMKNSFGDNFSTTAPPNEHRFWKVNGFDYVEPNTRNGFFDPCVIQRFFPVDPSPQPLMVYTDNQGVAIEDVYSNANSFESQYASISGELHTFCVGGPRYFQNNTLLENSPSWGLINPAKDIHNICIFRDTKHVYGSLLFRHNYECPTNPSLMHHVDQDAWWDINHREDDCFLDSDKYGSVASQLTHIPQLIGYDYGNVLTYSEHIDNQPNNLEAPIKTTLHGPNLMRALRKEVPVLPFNLCSDPVAVVQRDVLHDPSIYVINRKSVLVNKPCVYYNDDSCDIHCGPLSMNALKWSEGFLGDNVSIKGNCKYEEPIWSIVMDADYPKLSVSEQGGRFYNGVAYPTFAESGTEFKNFPTTAILSAKANWCMRAITCTKDNIPHVPQQQWLLPRRSLVESRDDWFYEDNLLMKIKNGESVSLLGLLGMSRRRHINQSLSIIKHIVERFTSNVCHSLDSPKFDDIIAHHAKEIVSHLMRSGNVVPLLYPFDMDGVFDDCPYDVINDHLRCWNSIDEKVVGMSVTTPIFSDGVVDYHPHECGPGFLMCGVPMHMHSKLGDAYNKHYSGFVYHPEQFRMGANRLQYMDLSPSTTCLDHVRMHDLIQERKDHRPECYIHSRCTPRNDQLPVMGINDDNRQKIP